MVLPVALVLLLIVWLMVLALYLWTNTGQHTYDTDCSIYAATDSTGVAADNMTSDTSATAMDKH